MAGPQPTDAEDSTLTLLAPTELYFAFDGAGAHYIEAVDVDPDELPEGATVADVAAWTCRASEALYPQADASYDVDGTEATTTIDFVPDDPGIALGVVTTEMLLTLRTHYPAYFEEAMGLIAGPDEDQEALLTEKLAEVALQGTEGAEAAGPAVDGTADADADADS